jgi:hypothetical protein
MCLAASRAFASLRKEQRHALVLLYVDDLKQEEAAGEMGITRGRSRRLVASAKSLIIANGTLDGYRIQAGPCGKPITVFQPVHHRPAGGLVGQSINLPRTSCTEIPGLGNGMRSVVGGLPLYRNGVVVGAVGVSGDGIDQADQIAAVSAVGFAAPEQMRADQFSVRTNSSAVLRRNSLTTLQRVQGQHGDLLGLPVGAGQLSLAAVVDGHVRRVPLLDHLQPFVDLAAQRRVGEVVGDKGGPDRAAQLFDRGQGGVLRAAAGKAAQAVPTRAVMRSISSTMSS